MSHDRKIIIIDGSSYLYRAYYALPPLNTSTGIPTNAIYGVINMLKRVVSNYHPSHIVVVFDSKGKTFRHELYPAYKANRPSMPEELRLQIEPLHKLIKALGFPIISIAGIEADDIIGTLAVMAKRDKIRALISTNDKDLLQLVDQSIHVVNSASNVLLDHNGVRTKFGVPPELIVDYLALVGDSSDNIPGVSKVGPKTAVKWLDCYGNLDNIITNADEIKGKVGENLRDNLDQLYLSRRLVKLVCDIKLNVEVEQLKRREPDFKELAKLYEKLEFHAWLAALNHKTNTKKMVKNYQIIFNKEVFDSFVRSLERATIFAFDTETTCLNYMQAKIVGLSFALKANHAVYIPVAHDYPDVPSQLDREYVLNQLKPILENSAQCKIGHNLKYDKAVLANHNINLQGVAYDTLIEAYLLNNTSSRYNLDTLALKYLSHQNIHYEDVAGKDSKQIPFNKVDIEKAGPYAAEDADISLQLHEYFWPKIENSESLKTLFKEIEMPLANILCEIQRTGVLVDVNLLEKQGEKISNRISDLQKQIYIMAGEEFNLESPKQLQSILYDKLGLPILKKTPKGQPSTAEVVLHELSLDFPLPKLVLEYRTLSKLKSTYIDKLPRQINHNTKRIHTSYHQTGTVTGRISSSDPNLQNIPIRTAEGRQIRKAFIVPKSYKMLAADYSQIELRIMAHVSQDARLLDAFAEGLDIHKATAAEIFGVDLDAVTSEQRRKAKAINFGLIYGMSAFGLAKQIGVERVIAQTYIDAYFAQYTGVYDYMEKTRELAHKQGYVETLYGRRLYIAMINNSNRQLQKAAERAAINAPIQGTAADIIKRSMILVDDMLKHIKLDAKVLMQVHDELVFEVAEKDVEIAKHQIAHCMMQAADLDVPLIIDIGCGDNWDEAHI